MVLVTGCSEVADDVTSTCCSVDAWLVTSAIITCGVVSGVDVSSRDGSASCVVEPGIVSSDAVGVVLLSHLNTQHSVPDFGILVQPSIGSGQISVAQMISE